ncbi:hypothetical protein [Pectobacterium betavasculorum]|uniref:hypothetical protein n=1 Tax=Pectobacterium betavasculorum TaxID=55207 RepID=UPI000A51F0AD|nr:hypothetical protein [Pectobacterium betavasculorum]
MAKRKYGLIRIGLIHVIRPCVQHTLRCGAKSLSNLFPLILGGKHPEDGVAGMKSAMICRFNELYISICEIQFQKQYTEDCAKAKAKGF